MPRLRAGLPQQCAVRLADRADPHRARVSRRDHPGVAAAEDVDALLRTLHYVTAGGERLTGLEANVAAWQHTRWGFAWRWLLWPLVQPIASRVYDFWAHWRYRRLYGETAHSGSGDR